jgi:hypothetical protein
MPLSTSNSKRFTASDRPGVAQPVPVRDVPAKQWGSIVLAALAVGMVLIGGWEWYWRDFGAVPGYRDDDALWARQRRRIDEGDGDATVLIGASRTLFDTQLQVWERLSGRRPIQLALDGTSPLFALEDLANDPRFTGRLLIGIAPDVFFSGFQYHKGLLRYMYKESPSQRVGKYLSMHLIEPHLAFYDPDFAMFSVLRRLPWPEREGLARIGVRKLEVTDEADRNDHMWSKVQNDPAYAALARRIWAQDFDPPTPAEVIENQHTADEQITRTAAAVAKLRARGIPVIFIRDPSAGAYLAYENRDFPRNKTWDVLLVKAHADGIHFQDFPELQGYDLPEGSHMTRDSAERYTSALYRIIQRDHELPGGARW